MPRADCNHGSHRGHLMDDPARLTRPAGGRLSVESLVGMWPAVLRTALGAGVLVCAVALAPSARACGFHDASSVNLGMLNLAFPDALYVRTAVWMAQRDGVLARPEPVAADSQSAEFMLLQLARLREVQMQLGRLKQRIEGGTAAQPMPAFAVVLIGALLWTRFEQEGSALNMALHATGPAREDVVVVTDAPVIAALADDRLSLQGARDRGLVRFYGAPDVIERVAGLLDRRGQTEAR
jgi:hypothetical protein